MTRFWGYVGAACVAALMLFAMAPAAGAFDCQQCEDAVRSSCNPKTFTSSEAKCRKTLSKNIGKVQKTAAKVSAGCHKDRNNDKREATDDCNDLTVADTKKKLEKAQGKFVSSMAKSCPGTLGDGVLDEYISCTASCNAQLAISNPITTYEDLASCLACVAADEVAARNASVLGNPTAPIDSKEAKKCHQQLSKSYDKYLQTILKNRSKCQDTAEAKEDACGLTSTTCGTDDPKDKISGALSKAAAGVTGKCAGVDFSVFNLAGSCAGVVDADGYNACATPQTDATGETTLAATYSLAEEGVCPLAITTTIRGGYGAVCSSNADCQEIQVCLPAGAVNRCQTETILDVGWTGESHAVDTTDDYTITRAVTCPEANRCGDNPEEACTTNADCTRCTDDLSACTTNGDCTPQQCAVDAAGCSTNGDCARCSDDSSVCAINADCTPAQCADDASLCATNADCPRCDTDLSPCSGDGDCALRCEDDLSACAANADCTRCSDDLTPCATNGDCTMPATCDLGIADCTDVGACSVLEECLPAATCDVTECLPAATCSAAPLQPVECVEAAPCGNCTIAGVSPLDPQYNEFTRCEADTAIDCTLPFQNDPACPGGGLCGYYLGPPLPISSANSPTCSALRIAEDLTGTANPDDGTGAFFVDMRSKVHLGIGQTQPCPVCTGDPSPQDGKRGADCNACSSDEELACNDASECPAGDTCDPTGECGTCDYGSILDPDPHNGAPCDVQGFHGTFGGESDGLGLSLDCPPTDGKNISGAGLIIPIDFTTGTASLPFETNCDEPFPPPPAFVCACGMCSIDETKPCVNNADCDLATEGTCTGNGGGQAAARAPNKCSNLVCDDIGGGLGQCTAGGVGDTLMYCDGDLRASGEGYLSCSDNTDCGSIDGICSGGDCGNCTLTKPRPCFLDPIVMTGEPDVDNPILAATFCVPPTNNNPINVVVGSPGPGRVRTQAVAKATYK